MLEFLKSLYTNKKRLAILVVVILIIGYFTYKHLHTAQAQTSYVLGQASNQTIITSVSGTGQVSQDHTVNVTPSSSGKLTAVDVKQGQAVKSGQTIAVVDETSNTQSLNQAKAGLASAQASYDATLAGSTSQDLQLSQLSVQSAQASLDQANQNLQTVTKQQAQDVAQAQTTMLNTGLQAVPATSNIGNATIAITGTYTGTQQGSYVVTAFSSGIGLQFGVSGLETSQGNINKNSASALGTMGLYIQFSGTIYNNDSWTITIPNTASSAYNNNYNAYQTALTNQATALAGAQNQINSAQNNLQQAQINFQVKQQPPTDQQVESAKASLLQAQTSLANAELAYNNNILKAPFDGMVAALNNQAGDQVSASTNVATVVNNQTIATIPLNEVDVAKVAQGDKATMNFDAVDGLTITGKVVEIDNIGAVSQGVVSYNVKIAFDTEDPRVKPGMSVSASIITNVAADVLSVPNSAIQSQGANSFVEVIDPSNTQAAVGQQGVVAKTTPTRVMVQTGASDDTNTQITGGSLKAGDSVVTQTITSSTTKSAAATATSALRLGGAAGGFGGAASGGFGGGAARGGAAAGR